MAKLTREQLIKWNDKAQNGFTFDIQYFLIWNEKTLIKDIEQEDGTIIRFKLWYRSEYETKTNSYGCKWNERTGKHIPVMKIEKLIPTKTGSSMYSVHTIKDNMQMGKPEKTLKYATLCKISGIVNTDEELKKIA